MERKDKPFRKKTVQDETKPFNKNFYGKKVESSVGVNKNKATKKWQPNDDLNEQTETSLFETKRKNKYSSESINTPSGTPFKKKSFGNEDSKFSDFKKKERPAFTNDNERREQKFDKELPTAGKKRTYAEYKNSSVNKSSEKDEYKETSSFKRKSIYDKTEDKPKSTFKKEYKISAKPTSKGPSKPRVVKDPNDDSIRLNKFISNAGICSRREADELIKAGAVTVNGKVITEMGYKIKRTDLVNYGGQGLKPEKQIYILLNKPKDYITTSEDPQERRTVLELIKGACKERVYPVGRLDRNTTGLLLLTNDGELTDKITHPSFKQKKIYHVELDKPVKKEHLKAIEEGIELEDGIIKVDEIKYVDDSDSKKEIGITLHSGRNRIVRRIFEHFEYKVKKLDRVYFAGLTKKDLARGRWRFLTPMEINMLKMVQ